MLQQQALLVTLVTYTDTLDTGDTLVGLHAADVALSRTDRHSLGSLVPAACWSMQPAAPFTLGPHYSNRSLSLGSLSTQLLQRDPWGCREALLAWLLPPRSMT